MAKFWNIPWQSNAAHTQVKVMAQIIDRLKTQRTLTHLRSLVSNPQGTVATIGFLASLGMGLKDLPVVVMLRHMCVLFGSEVVDINNVDGVFAGAHQRLDEIVPCPTLPYNWKNQLAHNELEQCILPSIKAALPFEWDLQDTEHATCDQRREENIINDSR